MAFTQISTDGIKNGTITGSDLATNIDLTDSQKIRFGNSQDLQLFHDGNNSVITAGGAGDLQLTSTFDDVIIQAADNIFIKPQGGENGLQVYGDGAVKLYYDGSTDPKFETISTGVRATGNYQLPFADGNTGLRDKLQWVTEASYFDEVAYISVNRTAVSGAPSDMVFATGSVGSVSERLKIGSDGKIDLNASVAKFGNSHSTGTTYLFGHDIRFTNAGITTTTMTIDSSAGNVGIGNTSPAYAIDVRNDSATAYSASASPSNVIARVQNGSTQTNSHAAFLLQSTNDNGAVDFWWMTIVSQSTNYDGFLAFTARTTSSGSQELVRFANNGRVSMQVLALGSGNSHNSAKLVIQGSTNNDTTNAVFVKNSDETELFSLRNDGVFYTGVDGASPYNLTTSDAANMVVSSTGAVRRSTSSVRYKKDIADATFGLADVLKLKPKTFKSNATGEFADDKTYAGFTAEDIHDLGLTEFVQYNEANEPDALAYGNMVALMAKAIQELNAKVEALEAG